MLLPLKYRILCLLASFIAFQYLQANEKPVITYLGIEHGLSNNQVTCIYQDQRGFMWFGTYDGLNQYDGYSFKVYRNRLKDSGSLIHNFINVITQDAKGNLWVGTRRGISIYNSNTARFSPLYYTPYSEKEIKPVYSATWAIRADPNGNMYIATASAGLLFYNRKTQQAVQLPFNHGPVSDTRYYASALEYDNNHRLWLLIRGAGLCILDPKTNGIKIVNTGVTNGLSLQADKLGNLWIGTDEGVYKYEITSNKLIPVLTTHFRVPDLNLDNENNLWVASDGAGVFIINLATMAINRLVRPDNKELLTSKAIFSVYQDKDGRKWIGTLRGGINVIEPGKNRFGTIRHDPLNANSLVNDFTLSFCEDREQGIWIGTDGGGISYWNRRKNTYTNFQHQENIKHSLSCDFVCSILNDYQNNVWIAMWGGGINRYNKAKRSFEHFACIDPNTNNEDKYGWFLYEDAQKTLWASTCNNGRLYWYNRDHGRFEQFDKQVTDYLTLAEDRQGNFWGGNFSTLVKIDRKEKKHQVYHIGNPVRSIHEDRQGRFWIGTEGGGLLLFNRNTGNFIRFSEAEGLCSNSILTMLEDNQGKLWISTFDGISKFDPQTRAFTNFSQSDGLQSNQFNYNAGVKLQSGEFIFGGIKGFNLFYPDSIYTLTHPVQIWLTGVKVTNTPIEEKENASFLTKRTEDRIEAITLPFNKAVLSIDFVALNYSAPDKINYAYYLEGWDKAWNYVGKARTANYTRLNEGRYTFRVKATDAEGHWLKQEQQLQIRVLPPWYRTGWAWLLYGIAFISGGYLYIRYKAQQTKQKYQMALAKMETEKEKELNEKKLSFFTHISHEFRAPLTLIINPVKELFDEPGKTPDPEKLNIVYRNARRLLSLVDQLLLFRKTDSEMGELKKTRVNLYKLCHEVYICFLQQAKAHNIQYEFSGAGASIEILADRQKMEIVLFNLVSNAFKFTPNGGKIMLEILEKGNNIEVSITDTGCGIEEDTGNRIFEKFYQTKKSQETAHSGFGIGLYLVKQFVEAHNGTIWYESKLGEGARFTINLPVYHTQQKETAEHPVVSAAPVLLEELLGNNEVENTLPDSNRIDKTISAPDDLVSVKKAVLIVDDNNEMRQYLRHLLAGKYLVYEAENGEAGLQMALRYIPDIIISDVVMGGITGVEFCRRLKADTELGHIPVILLTATTADDIKLKGIECGAEDYITKPFDAAFLMARVANILRSRNTLQQYFLDTVTLKKNTVKVSAEHRQFLERCMDIIDKEIDNDSFTVKEFTKKIGMSHSGLYKKIRLVSGLSPNAFVRHIRLRRAALLLLSTNTNINEACYAVGINDPKYFRIQFNKLFGMNPSEYVKKYKASFIKEYNVVNPS
jgi:signal transduction histidine kinase/ligand-binding sensor domain-containing protein/DNA-binding response OmpR family regulator